MYTAMEKVITAANERKASVLTKAVFRWSCTIQKEFHSVQNTNHLAATNY